MENRSAAATNPPVTYRALVVPYPDGKGGWAVQVWVGFAGSLTAVVSHQVYQDRDEAERLRSSIENDWNEGRRTGTGVADG